MPLRYPSQQCAVTNAVSKWSSDEDWRICLNHPEFIDMLSVGCSKPRPERGGGVRAMPLGSTGALPKDSHGLEAFSWLGGHFPVTALPSEVLNFSLSLFFQCFRAVSWSGVFTYLLLLPTHLLYLSLSVSLNKYLRLLIFLWYLFLNDTELTYIWIQKFFWTRNSTIFCIYYPSAR